MNYQIISVVNPNSSNASRVAKRIAKLEKKLGTNIASISSERDPLVFKKKFSKSIREYAKQPTIVLIGGGDGTVHQVVNAVIDLPNSIRKNTILFPIWGGNANDLAYMLNGISVAKDLHSILVNGSVVQIHPLEIELSTKLSKTSAHAICYASFGASAYAADELEQSGISRRGFWKNIPAVVLARELLRIVTAFSRAPVFKARVNGKKVRIFEQVFTNGSRIAKIDRLPVNLTDKAFYTLAQPNKHPLMLLRVLKLLTGKQVGKVTNRPVSFQVREAVLAQYDGEIIRIPNKTKVKISISDTYICALSTRLQ